MYGDKLLYELIQTNPTSECEINITQCYGG